MQYNRLVFIFAAFVTGIIQIGCQQSDPDTIDRSEQRTKTPSVPTETLTGTLWIDRWGQGHFGPGVEFVDEALFPELRDHKGVPIRITQAIAWPETIPGDLCLTKFDGLDRLPNENGVRNRF